MSGEFINKEFIQALKDLEKERGISMDVILEAIEAALIAASKKNFGSSQNVRVEIDKETGEVHVYYRKTVVEEVEDDRMEISLAEARTLDPDFELGDVLESEVTPRSFGRIAAQTAKQVVVQRIREAERNVIYDTYISREGEMVTGQVERVEFVTSLSIWVRRKPCWLLLNRFPGKLIAPANALRSMFLRCVKPIKARRCWYAEPVPGCCAACWRWKCRRSDGTVEIKAVVRETGQRSKVAVYSKNENVDCVGACVGSRGMRIQAVGNELAGEKIEVVKWSPDPAEFITNAMSPAKVVSVDIDEENKFAQVVVPDYQLSLAIGKEGQNARLAVRLTNWKIDIKSESQMAEILANAQAAADGAYNQPQTVLDDPALAEMESAETAADPEQGETTAEDTAPMQNRLRGRNKRA